MGLKANHMNLPALTRRMCRVLRLSLILSLPCFLINLLVQGGKEFRPELETHWKYWEITQNMKREDR